MLESVVAPEPRPISRSAGDNRCRDVLVSIRRIIRAVDLHSHYLAQTFNLTGPQLYVLQALTSVESMAAGDLADVSSMSQATVTGILNRLEKRELIVRRRSDKDRRSVLVSITDPGRELLRNTPPDLQEAFVASFLGLDDWDQSMIVSALQRVVKMMEASSISAAPLLTTGELTDPAQQDPHSDKI